MLAVVGTGLQVWLSSQPAWALFKTSFAGLLAALVLVVIVLGKEFHWWTIDGETLDHLGMLWIVLTLAVMSVTYWQVR